jgi:hypothetical protein
VSRLATYHDIIERKRVAFQGDGLSNIPALNPAMFDHQRHATEFALRKGRAALFLDTGLGKSLCALDWGRIIVEHTNKPVLMLAPLAVAQQHAREAEKFGIEAQVVRSGEEVGAKRIYITNYDQLDKFDADRFAGIILDESSVIKNFTGKTTRKLIDTFAQTITPNSAIILNFSARCGARKCCPFGLSTTRWTPGHGASRATPARTFGAGLLLGRVVFPSRPT